jgi:hypothetical protein
LKCKKVIFLKEEILHFVQDDRKGSNNVILSDSEESPVFFKSKTSKEEILHFVQDDKKPANSVILQLHRKISAFCL